MSWWGADDSGDDSDLFSSDEEARVEARPSRAAPSHSNYALDDSSSDDEGKRVVKSKKDARFDDVTKSLEIIAARLKINDWGAIAEGMALLAEKQKCELSHFPHFSILFCVCPIIVCASLNLTLFALWTDFPDSLSPVEFCNDLTFCFFLLFNHFLFACCVSEQSQC